MAIIVFATIGIALLKGGQILNLTDHIGLLCITAVGYLLHNFEDD